ncbi:hypothetical protein B6U98_01325 [Thermoplasmatales archaeon ex4572_165]|nr:MAG: hypothetical protein B6U98_01325 [Thermoplasmatales archaeon ex4572_165]
MKYKLISLLISIMLLSVSINILNQNLTVNGKSTNFNTSTISENMNPDVVDMIQSINHTLVYDYHQALMSFGPRYTGSKNCSDAGNYLYDSFQSIGLNTEKTIWNFKGFSSYNIEATIEGTHPNKAIFIMSAHYDCTKGSLGADDDGSGVAALLAIANVMSKYSFNNTIKFVAFSGEEVGTYGSFSYARDAYRNEENIHAVLNVDMIGYANSNEGGKKIRFHSPKRSEWIVEQATQISYLYEPLLDITVQGRPNYIGADHQAFVDYGYDGVWIAHHDGYPWANTPEDNPEHLNWSYQLKATKVLCAILAEMSLKPISLQIQLLKPYEGYGYFGKKPLLLLDLGSLWSKEKRGITMVLGTTNAEARVISDEEITYVVFCINNNFMNFDSTPPYTWDIQGKHAPPIGSYTLRAYVYSENGQVASDEMDIWSFSLNYYYSPW